MTEKPLLRLPEPKLKGYSAKKGNFQESIRFPRHQAQTQFFNPKFQRIEKILLDPKDLSGWTQDPNSIAPERALVFEIASNSVNFEGASSKIDGLEFIGEDFHNISPVREFENVNSSGKDITLNVYLTMPNSRALGEILRLWNLYKNEQKFQRGLTVWRTIFESLVDIRPWGPNDRLTKDTVDNWKFRLEEEGEKPIRLEVEFWYRVNSTQRQWTHTQFREIVKEANGKIIHQSTIPELYYDAALIELPAEYLNKLITDSRIKLVAFSDIMYLLPQSTFKDLRSETKESWIVNELEEPFTVMKSEMPISQFDAELVTENPSDIEFSLDTGRGDGNNTRPSYQLLAEIEYGKPIVAMLDGLPMANHAKLAGRLSIDDPDIYAEKYSKAAYFEHGTSMASAIIHGDLNSKSRNSPITSKLYVRPIMYPVAYGFEGDERWQEQIPDNRLILDVTWQCFKRMFEGENDEEPSAPHIKIINLSLGNQNRRFHNAISPWARLIDYIAWKHKVLILVSAGNVLDGFPIDEVKSVTELEDMDAVERQELIIQGLLKQRASRTLLSPAESVNAITVGARHFDEVAPTGSFVNRIKPYMSENLPNPSSAIGLGYLRSIKPDILMPGGRELLKTISNELPICVYPSETISNLFGIGTAAPDRTGDKTKVKNYSGTSVSTALATHYSVKIIQELIKISNDPILPNVPKDFLSVVAKTLLVHSAKWDIDLTKKIEKISEKLGVKHWYHKREDVTRLSGFGSVDTQRLFECTASRATLVGWGLASSKSTKEYLMPLPSQLKNISGYKAITITVGWFTPINIKNRNYWKTKFRVVPKGENSMPIGLDTSKTQPAHYSESKGTIFHKRWEGTKASKFLVDGELSFDVICDPTAGVQDEDIPYSVAASIEVGDELEIPVYDEVRTRLRKMIRAPLRP